MKGYVRTHTVIFYIQIYTVLQFFITGVLLYIIWTLTYDMLHAIILYLVITPSFPPPLLIVLNGTLLLCLSCDSACSLIVG